MGERRRVVRDLAMFEMGLAFGLTRIVVASPFLSRRLQKVIAVIRFVSSV
jgi:hypothetical protein